MKPTKEQAKEIYRVLVTEAGADGRDREEQSFVQAVIEPRFTEWRFMGKLGFGGKFKIGSNKWYIDCYKEEMTPVAKTIIDKVNFILSNIKGQSA